MIDSIGLFDYFCAKEDSKARVDKDPVELEGIVEEEEEPGGNWECKGGRQGGGEVGGRGLF